jgi:hypothetical protein
VGLEGCPYSKNNQQKSGSDHTTSEPLFISTALFDLLVAYPLTLLLIGTPPWWCCANAIDAGFCQIKSLA